MSGPYQVQASIMLAAMGAVYLLPTAVAVLRGRRVAAVATVNIFTGWTIAGWFWSLVMALL